MLSRRGGWKHGVESQARHQLRNIPTGQSSSRGRALIRAQTSEDSLEDSHGGHPLGPLCGQMGVSFPWGPKKTSTSPGREPSFKRTNNNSSTFLESGSSPSLQRAAREGGRPSFTKKEGGTATSGILKGVKHAISINKFLKQKQTLMSREAPRKTNPSGTQKKIFFG